MCMCIQLFFFSSRRRHTRFDCDWSSDVCSSDLSDSLPCTTNVVSLSVMKDPIYRTIHIGILRLRCTSSSLVQLTVSNAPEMSTESSDTTFFFVFQIVGTCSNSSSRAVSTDLPL